MTVSCQPKQAQGIPNIFLGKHEQNVRQFWMAPFMQFCLHHLAFPTLNKAHPNLSCISRHDQNHDSMLQHCLTAATLPFLRHRANTPIYCLCQWYQVVIEGGFQCTVAISHKWHEAGKLTWSLAAQAHTSPKWMACVLHAVTPSLCEEFRKKWDWQKQPLKQAGTFIITTTTTFSAHHGVLFSLTGVLEQLGGVFPS